MDIKAYIESGVLEMYAMDLLDVKEREEVQLMLSLFPEIADELSSIHRSLDQYAKQQGIQPAERIKSRITDTIFNLQKEEKMEMSDLPVINKFSDSGRWLRLIKDQIPTDAGRKDRFVKVLRKSDSIIQMLIVSSTDFEDEVHEDLYESFLILEGRCKCIIDDEVRYMEAGEFMEIPLHAHHTVEILSDTVSAILQRVNIPASL